MLVTHCRSIAHFPEFETRSARCCAKERMTMTGSLTGWMVAAVVVAIRCGSTIEGERGSSIEGAIVILVLRCDGWCWSMKWTPRDKARAFVLSAYCCFGSCWISGREGGFWLVMYWHWLAGGKRTAAWWQVGSSVEAYDDLDGSIFLLEFSILVGIICCCDFLQQFIYLWMT